MPAKQTVSDADAELTYKGKPVQDFFNADDNLSGLMRVKSKELVDHVLIIKEIAGTITGKSINNPAEQSTAYRVVVSYADGTAPADHEMVWLCNTESVLGRQLADWRENLPFRARLIERESGGGRTYYTFDQP